MTEKAILFVVYVFSSFDGEIAAPGCIFDLPFVVRYLVFKIHLKVIGTDEFMKSHETI